MSWALWALLVVLVVPLAAAAAMGSFSRYLADDYCTLGSLRDFGFFGSQVYWYTHWSGRYAFTFTVNLFETLGAWVVPMLPVLTLVALLASLRAVFNGWLDRYLGASSRLATWAIGGLVVFETIAGAPNLYQSLYWQTGVITYVFPLVLASVFAAWVLRRHAPAGARAMAVAGLAILVTIAYSETVGSLQVAALAGSLGLLILLAEPGATRTQSLKLLSAGLVGGIVGLLIMAAAPGNAVRQALLTPTTNPLTWLTATARNAYLFSVRTLRGDSVRLFLGLVLPFVIAVFVASPSPNSEVGRRSSLIRRIGFLVALPPFVFALVMACMAPTQYAMSSYPDGRLLISAQFTVAVGVAVWGAAAGIALVHYWPRSNAGRFQMVLAGVGLVAIVWLGWSGVGVTRRLMSPLPDARDFAARSDERLAKVLEARRLGTVSLPVASLTHMGGLDEISAESTNWVNVCFAQAYGLKHVWAK